MIAIGVTSADGASTAPLPHVRCGNLAVLYTDRATSPRDRMTACLRCAEQMRSFLPLTQRAAVCLDAAAQWVRSHQSHTIAELKRLSGMAQLTMSFTAEAGGTLRARAAARREAVDLADQVERLLSPSEMKQSYCHSTLTLHAMLPRSGAAHWQNRLAVLAPDRHTDVICVGPWPPFCFFKGPS